MIIFGLVGTTVCVLASSSIDEKASIGSETFEPFTTHIEITNDCFPVRSIAKTRLGPIFGLLAYQICDLRSFPALAFVGPVSEIHKSLSEGVRNRPSCLDA